jgi:hypothetical protein
VVSVRQRLNAMHPFLASSDYQLFSKQPLTRIRRTQRRMKIISKPQFLEFSAADNSRRHTLIKIYLSVSVRQRLLSAAKLVLAIPDKYRLSSIIEAEHVHICTGKCPIMDTFKNLVVASVLDKYLFYNKLCHVSPIGLILALYRYRYSIQQYIDDGSMSALYGAPRMKTWTYSENHRLAGD